MAWLLRSDLVDPKVLVQVLNDVQPARCHAVPQGEQAEEHLAGCAGAIVDDDVPGPLGNQGILGHVNSARVSHGHAMAMSETKGLKKGHGDGFV